MLTTPFTPLISPASQMLSQLSFHYTPPHCQTHNTNTLRFLSHKIEFHASESFQLSMPPHEPVEASQLSFNTHLPRHDTAAQQFLIYCAE